MTPDGTFTTLYTFTDHSTNLTLMQAGDGAFYITTQFTHIGSNRYGALFKMTGKPSSVKVKLLHSFGNGNDGKFPDGPVVIAPNGNLYGETSGAGTGTDSGGDGIIYEITTDGSNYTIVHNFNDGSIPNDGISPVGGLTVGADSNLYGATAQGGAYGRGQGLFGWGTLFKLSP